MSRAFAAGLLLTVLFFTSAVPATETATAPEIRRRLESGGMIRVGGRLLNGERLAPFYRDRDFAPVWTGEDGARRARLLLAALNNAGEHGLNPADYAPVAAPPALYDLQLTDGFARYAANLRRGRVRPGDVERDWAIEVAAFDPLAALARALPEDDFARLLAVLPPPHPGYARLKVALARYRNIVAAGGWPPMSSGPALKPGRRDPRVPLLRRRLTAEGEFVAATIEDDRYDSALEAAVRRFQRRHGLAVDSVVGPATGRALNVTAEDRVRQIVLNMTRWRWLPRDLGRRYLAVNAAAATLEAAEDDRTAFTSKVIVGKPRTPTPVTAGTLTSIVFNPPWNVPRSIAVNEILPRLRRDPRNLVRENMVILGRPEDPFGLAVDWTQAFVRGFRFRQLPGPGNALGRIKFDFTSPYDVYLHDTPDQRLFEHPRRFFSHGCVRVERPRELAAHLLAEEGWNRDAIESAIAAGITRRVPLSRTQPVYLLYWTAFVESDGTVQFREDVYGRDRRLAARLAGIQTSPADKAQPCEAETH